MRKLFEQGLSTLCGHCVVVSLLNWTPIFGWCKIRFVVKCKEDACYDEICLCVQIINIGVERERDHLVVQL